MRYTLIDSSATIQAASAAMRERDADALLVVDASEGAARAAAVIFASDIVTRVIALGLDPGVLTVSDLVAVTYA
jgi:CBS domain-containing protein